MINREFSIYESPFSDETKKLRLNSMLASLLCLFVGLTGKLPYEFSLLGIDFSSDQQQIVGWFMLAVSTYLFVHFMSSAFVELASWVHPFYRGVVAKKKLLTHIAFDEEDFMNWDIFLEDSENKAEIKKAYLANADWYVQGKLRPLYFFIYPKLIVEVVVPMLTGVSGVVALCMLITK